MGLPPNVEPNQIKYTQTNKNTCVNLELMEHDIIIKIMEHIHFPICKEKFFNQPLYCKPITASDQHFTNSNKTKSPKTNNVIILGKKDTSIKAPVSQGVFGALKDYLFSPPKDDDTNQTQAQTAEKELISWADDEETETGSEEEDILGEMTPSQLTFSQKLEKAKSTQNQDANPNKRSLTSPADKASFLKKQKPNLRTKGARGKRLN